MSIIDKIDKPLRKWQLAKILEISKSTFNRFVKEKEKELDLKLDKKHILGVEVAQKIAEAFYKR